MKIDKISKLDIPEEYRKRKITWQDVLNILAVTFIGFLFILFMGGILFEIEMFKRIFWSYLTPIGLLFLGFYIRGKIDSAYGYRMISKKNSRIEELKDRISSLEKCNTQLQNANAILLKELERKEHELTGKHFQNFYGADMNNIPNVQKDVGADKPELVIPFAEAKVQ